MKRVFLFLVLAIFTIGCSSNLKNNEDDNSLKKDCIVGILDDNLYSDSKFIDNLIYDLNTRFNIHTKKLTIDETEHFDLEDANLIFGIGFNMDNYIGKLAEKNPERNFILMDSVLDLELDNLKYAPFDLDDSAFVSGMILYKKSKSSFLGFFGGDEIDIIKNAYYSFCAGAKYEAFKEDKDVGINLKYLHSFHDLNGLKTIANDFYIEKVDSLFSFACGMDESLLSLLGDDVYTVSINDYLGEAKSDLIIKKDYAFAIAEIIKSKDMEIKPFNLFNDGVKLIFNLDDDMDTSEFRSELYDLLKDKSFSIPNSQIEYDLFLNKIKDM